MHDYEQFAQGLIFIGAAYYILGCFIEAIVTGVDTNTKERTDP